MFGEAYKLMLLNGSSAYPLSSSQQDPFQLLKVISHVPSGLVCNLFSIKPVCFCIHTTPCIKFSHLID